MTMQDLKNVNKGHGKVVEATKKDTLEVYVTLKMNGKTLSIPVPEGEPSKNFIKYVSPKGASKIAQIVSIYLDATETVKAFK